MPAGSQSYSASWTATSPKRLERYLRLLPHFPTCGKRCQTAADAMEQKLKDRRLGERAPYKRNGQAVCARTFSDEATIIVLSKIQLSCTCALLAAYLRY